MHCEMYEMGEKMFQKFNKYWGNPRKMNKFLFLSVVLDPRHKLQFLVYMLKDMYGYEVGGAMGKDVEETLSKMFDEYKSKMGMSNDVNSGRENLFEENGGPVHPSLRLRLQFERDNGMVSQGVGCSDLDEYLSEKPKKFTDDFDILGWWKLNSVRFPILSQMARDILAMPISTVASESAFSTGGRIISDFRSSLSPRMVQSLVCAQDWMRKTAKAINVEETHDDMVELEKDISKLDVRAGHTTPSTANSVFIFGD
ncbi:zinc finger BED domain-containing protein RICESLEEPER 2-like [Daucus carota subsp. sativus]|uniref:zinc finger BED domain-containing protein RICESLEEPER 2-like n=1 Tax=Daucus carota subsp. sativus TaxID=79200 RepID=UPI0007F048C6|nr:PREDICTED: zinc finger BED domain-containing protein RICESLEEPER 2-like isoform X2 [Daucus carota subsp. sativus]